MSAKSKSKKKSKKRTAKVPAHASAHAAKANKGDAKASKGKGRRAKRRKMTPDELRQHGKFTALAVLSGCMWFIACADFDIWPLAYVAMVPVLFAIMRAPTRRSALFYGWVAGVVANIGGFYWITGLLTRFAHLPLVVALLGLLMLAAYQAIVFWGFAAAIRKVRLTSEEWLGRPLPMVLLAPVIMVAFELLVPFLFPWYLAITQAWVIPVIQIAEITGPLGVTAFLMVINGAVYDVATETTRRRKLYCGGAAAAIAAVVLTFGFVRMGQIDAAREQAVPLRIGVVQGNIPFDEKGVERRELAAQQLRDQQAMSAKLEADGAEFIMWTETSYPFFLPRDMKADLAESHYARVRRGFKSPIMFGAITTDYDDKDAGAWNSALMLDAEGNITGRFDKVFLLMFGEYIPGLETFPWIRKFLPKAAGHFNRGKGIEIFPLEKDGVTYRLAPMICYEDILTEFGRKLAVHKPHLIVNVTNDAWFGETSEPWEHLALSVYRAVEMRTDMVRAVNTGVSAFIDANGRVMAETYAVDPKIHPKPVDGIVHDVVLMEGGHTLFARFGDVFGWLCVLLALPAWLVWPRLRRRRREQSQE